MSLSVVAGILDRLGGLRVVVTQRFRMRHHLKRNERLFVVPDFKVQEPVPWNDIPEVIAKTKRHVAEQTATHNPCGECHACCKTPYINDPKMHKPSHAMCVECDAKLGCLVHYAKPKVCRTFECLWLKSQKRNDVMGPELRPDRCGAYFSDDTSESPDPDLFEVHPDDTYAPLGDVARTFVDREQSYGRKAKLITSYHGENGR
jgi:hypothetical protein